MIKDAPLIIKKVKEHIDQFKTPIVEFLAVQEGDPFKILVATILSARTKDQTTSAVCKRLFEKIKKVSDFNKYSQEELEDFLKPVGFYKTKAKHLKQLPQVIKEKHDGNIPKTFEGLLTLPGVGRKTANLVYSLAFQGKGLCIDTHCHRIPQRIGWFKSNSPHETEIFLREELPSKYWKTFSHVFVAFGQHTCTPISPKCSQCPIKKECKRIGVKKSR